MMQQAPLKVGALCAQYSPDGGYIVFMSDRDNATGTAGAANMDMGFDLYLVRIPALEV